MSMYVSDDLKATYGPALNHLSNKLSGYSAVAVIGDQDTDDISKMMLAKGPEPQNSMLAKLAEKMFPGQSKQMMDSPENREAVKFMMQQIHNAWRNDGAAAGSARLMVGGKEVTLGFVYLPPDAKTTPSSAIGNNLPGTAREDRDAAYLQRQLKDTAIFTAAHELGHLVDSKLRGSYTYDVRKNPPMARLSQLESNAVESFADRFAAEQMRLMGNAGIVSNGKLAIEFAHARAIMGISDMLKARQGAVPDIDHTTGIIDDPHRLQTAATQINELWHDSKKDKKETPENMYAFMKELQKRNDIPPDVKLLANTYVNSYDYMMQGRTATKGIGAAQLAEAATSMQQNEPVFAHSEVDTKMLIKGRSVGEYFAQKAEGQAVQLALEIPEAKISKRIENAMTPA